MGLVLDTSALVAIERAGVEWEPGLADFSDEPAVLPAVVYAELLVGVRLADSPVRARKRRAVIDSLASRMLIVEFGREVAEVWAELFAVLSRSGSMIPANDLAVAATARYLSFGVLIGPKDESHYRKIPALRCELVKV